MLRVQPSSWFGRTTVGAVASFLLLSSLTPPWTTERVVPPVTAAAAFAPASRGNSRGNIVTNHHHNNNNPYNRNQLTSSRLTLSAGRFPRPGNDDEAAGTAEVKSRSASPTTTTTTTTTTSMKEEEKTSLIVVERPDPSILLSSQDGPTQRWAMGVIVATLVVGTALMVTILEVLHQQVLPPGWFELWRDYTWPIPLGFIYVAAGVAHFTMKDTFVAMVPPRGTWDGLWQIPAPGANQWGISYGEYHTYWSGIVEIGAGLLLIIAGGTTNVVPVPVPAFALFFLTVCVTPANIYMATHDIQPPGLPPVPYPIGHLGRGVLQCVLLAIFWELTFS